MQNRKIKRFIYRVRHEFVTMNNVVLVIAAVIAISWAWASVLAVQRNYALQREVDDKKRQEQLIELQTDNLAYEQRYYQSREYQTLEVKRRLGLVEPGEKVLILPPNTAAAKASDSTGQTTATATTAEAAAPPPLEQWMNFLFGGNRPADKKQ